MINKNNHCREMTRAYVSILQESCSEWRRLRREIVLCVDAAVAAKSQGKSANKLDGHGSDLSRHFSASVLGRDLDRADKCVFVIDDNLFYKSMRHEYLQVARRREY